MSGIRAVFEKGPVTYSASVNIRGGQLVEPDEFTARIKPTAGATTACLGVAMVDAAGVSHSVADTQDPWGNTVVTATLVPNEVAVAWQGVWRLKNAATGVGSGAIGFGDRVVTAANGEIMPYIAQDLDLIVGTCVEPGGIAPGAEGKVILGLG
ncbi:hypothetical protein [Pseudonocardia kunmingensis]|uniref:hypothetical protein n=1 Tax=Pseudonocardia kunmingensis TaxID=630975 RepID=UPI001152D1FA|nr:hypothetical protein [Pseudonocardia kunmingensis]